MNPFPPSQPSLFAKLLSLVVASAALVLAFMFSLVLIPVLLLIGTGLWFYLRWKMKQWQQTMAAQMDQGSAARRDDLASGDVIEGEAVVVREGQETVWVEAIRVKPESADGTTEGGPVSPKP